MTITNTTKGRYTQHPTLDQINPGLGSGPDIKGMTKRYQDAEKVYFQEKKRCDELMKVKGDASQKLENHYKELMTVDLGKLSDWVMMKVQLVETINAIDSILPLARERLDRAEKSYIELRLMLLKQGEKG